MIRLAANNSVVSNLCFILLILLGVYSLSKMNRELFPIFSMDLINVSVVYPGASPSEVESDIIAKIEDSIMNLAGVKRVSSSSGESIGSILIEVEEGEDVKKVKDEVNAEIDRITTFPKDMEKPIVQEIVRKEEMLYYCLTGPASPEVLREWAEKIKNELETVEGVSEIVIFGSGSYEIRIEIPEAQLLRFGLTIDSISRIVQSESFDLPGGVIKSDKGDLLIRGLNEKKEGDLFFKIPIVTNSDGSVITLKDIAKITDDFEQSQVQCRYFGDPSVILQVYRKSNYDGIIANQKVKDFVKLKSQTLPKTLKLVPWLETSVHIEERIELLLRNGWQGFVLVFLSLWLFMSFRLSFWVAMGIPASFGGALLLMYLTGQSINMISLFALIMALGIIVDDAIVVGENIFVHMKMGKSNIDAVIDGAKEVAWPVLGSVSTTIVAFIPMLLMTGIFGKFMRVIPYAMIAALLTSLFECFFILTGHLTHIKNTHDSQLSKARKKINGLIEYIVNSLYFPIFKWCLRFKYVFMVISFCVLGITMAAVKNNYIQFVVFPKLDQYLIDVSFELEEGAPFKDTQKIVDLVREKTLSLNELLEKETNGKKLVKHMISFTGETLGPMGGLGAHKGMVIVEILSSTERSIHSRVIEEKWRELIGTIPGVKRIAFGQAFNHGPGGKSIEINVKGENLEKMNLAVQEIKESLAKVEYVQDINDNLQQGKREVQYSMKESAQSFDINFTSLARQIRNHYYGNEALRFSRYGQDVNVMVSLPENERNSMEGLNQQFIKDNQGNNIPFYELVDFHIKQGLSKINRINGVRSVLISADVEKGGNAEVILKNFESKQLKSILKKYPEVTYKLEGQSEQTKESFGSLKDAYILIALPLIYFILASIFKSYLQPLLIMFVIPFGVIGAFLGHVVLGYDLSMFSMIGVVALSGIVINDSLVMIDFINRSYRNGVSLNEAIETAGLKRFRAIVLTSLTTVAGLLPLLFETSLQAQVIIPMAISISFGVLAATILTLLFVPVQYSILEDLKGGLRRVGSWVVKLPK